MANHRCTGCSGTGTDTASLDNRTEREVQRALERASRGVTTLVIAHRLSTVRDADLIAVMEEGRVVEQGRHDALLRLDGRYAALWRAQEAETALLGEE